MSFDALVNKICSHRIVREYHTLFADMQTVFIDRPVASTRNIDVFLNDVQITSEDPIVGFDLVRDNSKLSPEWRKLVFRRERKSTTDYVEISYFVTAFNCRRCQGLTLYDDISFTNTGQIRRVNGAYKLAQDMEKILYTVLQTNPFHLWYGTGLLPMIGQGDRNRSLLLGRMQREVYNAFTNLKNLQLQQAQYMRVPISEILNEVVSVTVTPSSVDPTSFAIDIVAIAMSGDGIEITKKVNRDSALILEKDLRTGGALQQYQGTELTNKIRGQLFPTGTGTGR